MHRQGKKKKKSTAALIEEGLKLLLYVRVFNMTRLEQTAIRLCAKGNQFQEDSRVSIRRDWVGMWGEDNSSVYIHAEEKTCRLMNILRVCRNPSRAHGAFCV